MKKSTYLLTLLLTALLCLPWTSNAYADEEIILSEGFEGTLSDNWTKVSCHSSSIPYSSAKRSGTKGFRFYFNTNPPQYLISKELSIPSVATGVNVTFWYKNYSSSNPEIFQVGYSTTTNSTDAFTWDAQITASNTQWTQYANSTPFPVGTKYIAIRYNSNDKYYLFVDDLEISYTYTPTCPKPTDLTKGAVTANSATFTWTAGGSESEWQYICLPAETALDWSDANVQTATTTSATVNSLTAETDYKFYLRAYCGTDNQSLDVVKAFATPCNDYPTADLPFEQNFNSATSTGYVLPDCWSRIAFVSGTSTYPYTYGNSGVDNSNCLRFYGGITGTSEQIAILPPFEAQINTLVISLAYKYSSTQTYYGTIKIGYITDPSDATTFHPLKELTTRTTSWNDTEVNKFALSAAPENSYIAIQYSGGSSYSGNAYIDNIKVAVPSSCTDPSDVNAAATSATSATVSWTENGSATAWNIQYSTDNFATHTDLNNVTTNPYTITTGLSGNTTYKVRVQSDCGSEQSDWVVSNEFTTPCEAVNGIGWSADFAGAATGSAAGLPGCWVKNSSNSNPYIYNYGARSNSRCLYFYAGSGASQFAILPPFNEATNTLYVTLWYNNAYDYADYCTESYGQLAIGYMTNPADASTFTAQELLPRVCTYTQAKVALTNAPAGSRVAIRYIGGSTTGAAFVDDIEISAIPTCVAPSGAKGVVSSSNSATISWTENGSATAWKVRYSSDNGTNWSSEVAANTNPFELTGLEASSTYVVQVMSICGEDEFSSWSASSASFQTPCGPTDASDYSENFENAPAGSGKLPDCWSYKQSVTLYSATYPYVYNYSGDAYEGDKSLSFYGGTSSSEQIVIMPEMDRALNELTIEFYYNAAESPYSTRAKLEVGYIAADGTTYNTIETLDYADAYTKYTKILSSVPADAKNIAFRYAGGASNSSAYIDNVRVYPTPTCATPTAVEAANFTANSAAISWTANASESAWKVQYSTDGTNWMDANEGNAVNANPYTLTGLAANTVYYARVKAVCTASDESPWSEASAAFRTDCNAITVDAEHEWVEGFESNAIGNSSSAAPHCWALLNANEGDYPYIYVNGGSYAHNSDRALFFNNKHLVESFAIFPEFTNALNTLQISFWHMEESPVKSGYLELGYLSDIADASTFMLLQQFERSNSYQFEEVNLASVPAGARLAFRYIGVDETYEYYSVVDDIIISLTPSCPHPRKVTAVALSATKATVAWTEFGSATAWQIRYSTDDKETWSSEVLADENPFTLEGLTPSTTYDIQVRAYCSESDQSVWEPADNYFTTDCDSKAIGWKETFDAQNAIPLCWNNSIYTGNYWDVDDYDEYHSSMYSARYNGRTATGNSADLITPSVNLDNNAMLVFWYRNAVTAEVYVKDGSTTTQLQSIPAQTTWKEAKIDLSDYKGKEVSFIFRAHGAGTSSTKYIYLDDVSVVPYLKDSEDNNAALSALNGKKMDVVIGRSIVCAGYYNTICLPFSLPTLSGTPLAGGDLWAFKYAKVDEATGELLFRIVEASSIEAGVPYFIAFPSGAPIVNPLFKNVTISATSGKSVGNDIAKLWGIVDQPEVFEPNDQTKLFLAANNTLYWWEGAFNSRLNNFRAFFVVNTGSGSHAPIFHGMPARIIKEEQVATGVGQVTNDQVQSLKVLENNQVVIIRNGVKYNVQGQVIEREQ